MAARKKELKESRPTPATPPRIFEAALDGGPSGIVLRSLEIALEDAIARRKAGLDVVVCGDDTKANARLARQIETGVGPCKQEPPHKDAGVHALPHFQPNARPPQGHTFYETENPQRKSRKSR
jgi:hypothetical protein